VQLYFPALDDLLEAAVRRRAGENLDRPVATLAPRPDEPLHVLGCLPRGSQRSPDH